MSISTIIALVVIVVLSTAALFVAEGPLDEVFHVKMGRDDDLVSGGPVHHPL